MSAAVAWIAPATVKRMPAVPSTRRPTVTNATVLASNKRVDFFMLYAIY